MNRDVAVRVITQPLGGSSLSRAIQEDRIAGLPVAGTPASVDQWRARADMVRRSAEPGWLDRLRPALSPGGAAAARLDRVARAQGVVVTTGQQAALFGGPVYTLSKALSALALADAIEERTGIPVAPVFWAATDDADFAEAATVYAADASGLHEMTLTSRVEPGQMMAALPLSGMQPLLTALRRVSGSASHSELLETACSAYQDGRTLGDAYVALMRALLEPLGVSVLDASHAAYRTAARPLLVEALRRAGPVAASVAGVVQTLRDAGFEPQVEDDRGLSLVFAVERGTKRRIAIADGPAAAASEMAFAPNVLLRPVVERFLLPTVAYVAGPGELAYFPQSAAVADALDRDRPLGVARWSCLIIEPFAARALARLGVAPDELSDLHALENRLARASLPPGVTAGLERLRTGLAEGMRVLRAATGESDLVPSPVVDGVERALRHRIERAERRLLAAAKRRDDQVRRDLAAASAALHPRGHRQERTLGFLPMLVREGPALLEEMQRQAATHAAQAVVGGGAALPATG